MEGYWDKRCKTCKYWREFGDPYAEIPGLGKCHDVVPLWDAIGFDEGDVEVIIKPKYSGKLAFVQDGSDYSAEFNTLRDFGCVRHVQR